MWPLSQLQVKVRAADPDGFLQKAMAHIMVDYELSPTEPLPADYLEPIKRLWADAAVKQAILKGNEYALHDNLE